MLYIIPGIVKTQNILGNYTERSTPPQWHHLHVYSRLWLPPPCFINHQSSIFFLSSRHLESLSLMDLLLTDILFVIVFLYFFLFLYYYFSKVSGGNGDKHVVSLPSPDPSQAPWALGPHSGAPGRLMNCAFCLLLSIACWRRLNRKHGVRPAFPL